MSKNVGIYESDTPTRRKLRDIYYGSEMSVERCRLILASYGIDPEDPILHSIHLWTEAERREAANWAMRENYHASDNSNLRQVMPKWLEDSKRRKRMKYA